MLTWAQTYDIVECDACGSQFRWHHPDGQPRRECPHCHAPLAAPREDIVNDSRRDSLVRLDLMRDKLWQVIDNPGPMVTVTGRMVTDPDTGKPLPDMELQLSAIRLLLEVNERVRRTCLLATLKEIEGAMERLRAEIADCERQAEEEADGQD